MRNDVKAGDAGRGKSRPDRRAVLGAGLVAGALAATAGASPPPAPWIRRRGAAGPVLVGSSNALAGMRLHYAALVEGAAPLDVAIEVVKVTEADPEDTSVGLGGLPNEDGVVQLDAACMDGETHNSGAVASLENILHPSEVARLVAERTDHCLLVGAGAYTFARQHGHPHVELLTERTRQIWLRWRETMSDQDARLPPRPEPEGSRDTRQGRRGAPDELDRALARMREPDGRITGTIHCSALSSAGHVACTTTTSGLSWKIPGRVGDSPIVGAGLYCEDGVGSAGATGRGEAAIVSLGSHAAVEMLRQGATPLDAGLEVLRRVVRNTQRQARWQPRLVDAGGFPTFSLRFYVLGLDGTVAGVTLRGEGFFAVADPDGGPRLEPLVALHGR
jgi:N4-(beta-N-acetylglucosaminyl)-L-asparaginase